MLRRSIERNNNSLDIMKKGQFKWANKGHFYGNKNAHYSVFEKSTTLLAQ